MKKEKIIIGSRSSKLALIYAQNVKSKIIEISDLQEDQIIIKGIAIDPNLISSSKLNLIPKKIIPNFKIYCCVKSKPTIIPGLGVNALPIKIPSKIAMRTVEIGLLGVPKISIAKTLFIPWENKQNTNANTTPGMTVLKYWKLIGTK